jgi:hypothetical protein
MTDLPGIDVEALTRAARRRHFSRVGIMLGCMAAVGLSIYFVLPVFPPLFRPATPPGGWVIGPSDAGRKFASLYSPAVVVPLCILPFLKRRWNRQDAAAGYEIKFKQSKLLDWSSPVAALRSVAGVVVIFGLLGVLLPFSFAFYLTDFTIVSEAGITDSIRFQRIVRGYDEVTAIDVIPAGRYSPYLTRHGPMVMVWWTNGRAMQADGQNGLTEQQTLEIADYAAARSGVKPRVPADVQ